MNNNKRSTGFYNEDAARNGIIGLSLISTLSLLLIIVAILIARRDARRKIQKEEQHVKKLLQDLDRDIAELILDSSNQSFIQDRLDEVEHRYISLLPIQGRINITLALLSNKQDIQIRDIARHNVISLYLSLSKGCLTERADKVDRLRSRIFVVYATGGIYLLYHRSATMLFIEINEEDATSLIRAKISIIHSFDFPD